MARMKLTDVERQAAESWKAIGLPIRRTNLGHFRSLLRKTAYHEAGHCAARMFTGQEASHITKVSVIPEGESLGYETSERNFAEGLLSSYPPPLQRSAGRCFLLGILAGRGAAARAAVPEERVAILDEDALAEEGEEPGKDLFRARRVADIMARPGMPAYRVLTLAEKWTIEMLALPEVWRTVETLAGLLLERGTIDDRDEIMTACDGIRDLGMNSRKWRRRLFPSLAELRPYIPEGKRLPRWKRTDLLA